MRVGDLTDAHATPVKALLSFLLPAAGAFFWSSGWRPNRRLALPSAPSAIFPSLFLLWSVSDTTGGGLMPFLPLFALSLAQVFVSKVSKGFVLLEVIETK